LILRKIKKTGNGLASVRLNPILQMSINGGSAKGKQEEANE
jgi:hypothetical protein